MKLSLCIPTNGVIEWVFPCLDSIYNQGIDENKFEVIVTDNGNTTTFALLMEEYTQKHTNIIYSKTNAYMFENQLEALKLATGDYYKFVNHRSLFWEGRLEEMITFLEKNEKEKPVIFFANGAMGWGPICESVDTFDNFVRKLGVFATWTSGVGIWSEDYKKLPKNFSFDKISPHSSILFSERNKNKYIINDRYWFKEIPSDHSKKGKYDLFKAFSLDEFIIIINLYRDGDISVETLKCVKNSFSDFLESLYCDFVLRKIPCSYDLSGFDKYTDIFFEKEKIKLGGQRKYIERYEKN